MKLWLFEGKKNHDLSRQAGRQKRRKVVRERERDVVGNKWIEWNGERSKLWIFPLS